MMNSINSFLLSIFTKGERYGSDVNSLHRRYQSLSLIYVNLGMTSLILMYGLVTWLLLRNPNQYIMCLVCFPLSVTSFLLLRFQKLDLSTLFLLFEMHASNFVTTFTTSSPTVLIYGIMMYPFFMFSLTSSLKLHLLNAAFCAVEYYLNIKQVMNIFEVTLTDEQSRQILLLVVGGLLCCSTAIGVSIIQKAIESTIWNIAQENYAKNENLTKELVQAMESKDSFVSLLSHEIRNPLNSLKGSIDYLLQVIKEYDHVQVLKNAKISGDILLNLVSNLLDAAKLKSDKMEIMEMETDFIETIKKVFTINNERFKEKLIFARAYVDESVPRLLWMDSSRILQILMNLISNAVKFTPLKGKINIYASWYPEDHATENLQTPFDNISFDGVPESRNIGSETMRAYRSKSEGHRANNVSLAEFDSEEENIHQKNMEYIKKSSHLCSNNLTSLSLSCWESAGDSWNLQKTAFLNQREGILNQSPTARNLASQKKGFLKIQITDTGCGIGESDLHKMFGMFQQTSQGARSVQGGTGLGLWICKQLCHKMGGDITVYSKVGQGSSFVLFIPIDNNPLHSTLVRRPTLIKDRVRALVVDDYSMNRYLHKLLLEQEGVEVVLATNGQEAVEKYKAQIENPFDFLMMDVQMPVMDGFTAAKLIREWEMDNERRKVDIYFVTGEYFNEREVLAGFRSQGGENEGIRCFKKPLGGEIISRIVSKYKLDGCEITP